MDFCHTLSFTSYTCAENPSSQQLFFSHFMSRRTHTGSTLGFISPFVKFKTYDSVHVCLLLISLIHYWSCLEYAPRVWTSEGWSDTAGGENSRLSLSADSQRRRGEIPPWGWHNFLSAITDLMCPSSLQCMSQHLLYTEGFIALCCTAIEKQHECLNLPVSNSPHQIWQWDTVNTEFDKEENISK